jgi:hypothetical protein
MGLFNKDPLETQLREIAKAESVAFGGVGFAGTLLPATQAYFSIEEALPLHKRDLQPKLERMLDSATPAGRIYAAELLTHVEAAAGQAAWRRLADQKAEVSTFQGCIMGKTTLHQYASERLDS